MILRLYNTLGRQIQDFEPLRAGEVGLYTCGPTVYNYAHIGNLRTYIFEDILRRTLEYFGFRVNHVMNVTDVGHLTDDADQGEDKMMKSAREMGKTVWEIAEYYTDAFFGDLEQLNVKKPTVACRATDHITEMIDLIKKLEERGFTYSAGGNIYFDISNLPSYGELALLNLDELKAGARIDIDEHKRKPLDFVLWFTRSKFEHQAMLWDSPWGRGYPGWHIECSAMSMKYLGEQFDIHCGGVDHISVHHTNEIAQSEAATGRRWVNYWLHGEFLIMAREKMAKSSGDFLTLSRLKEEGFEALDYRYFVLGAHYRSQLQFSFEGLGAARQARRNLRERVIALKEIADSSGPDDSAVVSDRAEQILSSFSAHVAEDLNTPQALADLWMLLKTEEVMPVQKLKALSTMDRILGLDVEKMEPETFQLDEETRRLLEEREEARREKNYTRSDEIRDLLKSRGYIIEDTPAGVRLKKNFP